MPVPGLGKVLVRDGKYGHPAHEPEKAEEKSAAESRGDQHLMGAKQELRIFMTILDRGHHHQVIGPPLAHQQNTRDHRHQIGLAANGLGHQDQEREDE